tara:strand:- start:358 stop:2067 length:1710 start_codon:yes stop_codon:yes gene_type:complete
LINFKYVRWKNFLSTGNQFIEIQLDKNPTTLIIGENGAGKSTILDALCFGLFGKPFRTISKNQLVNSVNNSSTSVEVEFTIGTRHYKVIRNIKPNKFEIYQNDKLMSLEANVRDYQKILEQQILKLNYRSFTQVVILGSSTFVPFMQLRSTHRREVVEEILDIQIFSTMNVLLKQKMKSVVEELREIEYQYDIISEKISLQENYIDDIQKNKDDIIKEKESAFNTNKYHIKEKTEEIESLEGDSKLLADDLIGEEQNKEKRSKLKDISVTLNDKFDRNRKMIFFLKDNDDCPTCKQHIDETFKSKTIKEKNEQQKELSKGLTKLHDQLERLDTYVDTHRAARKFIRENDIEIAKLKSSVAELEKFNAKLQQEINILTSGTVSEDDTKKLDRYKRDEIKIERQKSDLKDEKSYLDAIKVILQDTGIKTKIIKQYLPVMNNLINKYLTSMEFYVNFTLNENFEETIKSRYRDEFTYSSFSEGEKMRIDLSLLFTWRAIAKMKNSANTNLLILDEIFDSSLDGTGTDEFLKILNTLGDENVFVISHKQDVLADKFKSTIKFEKVKNFSHVVT